MEPNVEFIDVPLNGERYKRMSDKQRVQFWLNSIGKILLLILIVTLIVAMLTHSWSLLQNPTINNETNQDDNNNENPKIVNGECGSNWMAFKDEKCFQILSDDFQTFDEAVESCAQLENGATLPIIHSIEEQDFLSNYLFTISRKVENFWIGAKVGHNNTFRWIDDSDLTFTNWVTKGPKLRDNYCVHMQAEDEFVGKWIDEHCREKNFVVCNSAKVQSWSVDRMQKNFMTSRKYYNDLLEKANNKIIELKQQQIRAIEEVNQKIDENKQSIVPIGFVYAQLPNETSPQEIWPWMVWTDASATYAGVFFRVNGGDAAAFGQVQHQNAPRLAEVYVGEYGHSKTNIQKYPNDNVVIPKSGWSDGINTGTYKLTFATDAPEKVYAYFKLSTGEIRPRNMAIRIWKRIG